MFDFGSLELLIIVGVALLVLGPQDLARVMRQLGQALARAQTLWRQWQQQWSEPPSGDAT